MAAAVQWLPGSIYFMAAGHQAWTPLQGSCRFSVSQSISLGFGLHALHVRCCRKRLARRLCSQPFIRRYSMYREPSYFSQYATPLFLRILESSSSIAIPVHRPYDFGALT